MNARSPDEPKSKPDHEDLPVSSEVVPSLMNPGQGPEAKEFDIDGPLQPNITRESSASAAMPLKDVDPRWRMLLPVTKPETNAQK